MDQEYDVIVLGTGLKECILSGLLSVDGLKVRPPHPHTHTHAHMHALSIHTRMLPPYPCTCIHPHTKVLHMDRNKYYGGQAASLNLIQMYERFRGGAQPPAALGASRDWNIDLVPKFMMANGKLVKTLIYTDVTRYLDFKAVEGSYVLVGGKVHKVPATDMEALASPLMGFFEKRRARNFLQYVQNYDARDPKTHNGQDLTRMSMLDLYKYFGLEDSTIDFLGHAVALHRDDGYLGQAALPTVMKVKLYYESLMRFQGLKSPYIYPLYGLGELPQAFARLSAVHGATYMLEKPDLQVVYDDNGVATGVKADGETARAKMVVGDSSYFEGKSRKVGQVVRAICFLSHPVPNTDNATSMQMILPQKQIGRRSDMYVFCCSYEHNVAPKGRWIAFVSTTVETNNPEAYVCCCLSTMISVYRRRHRTTCVSDIFRLTHKQTSLYIHNRELAPGLALLGPVDEKFVEVVDLYEPLEDGQRDKCFISKGYDATSHFETTVEDVLDLYRRITGKNLDLSKADLSKKQETQ